jgi:hypothetical protein
MVVHAMMFRTQLVKIIRIRFSGRLSEVAMFGPKIVEVSQNAGNNRTNATVKPLVSRRLAINSVRAVL